MRPESMDQKTAVFTFASLAAEEPRSYDVDEPTRELPLIAGRFAGREWDVEELRRDYDRKQEAREARQKKKWFVPAVGAAAAVMLLIGALTGQAALVDVNEKLASAEREVSALHREQDALRLEYARSGLALETGQTETWALPQTAARQDKATVLNVRRGHELQYFWDSVVDVLGESLH